MTTQEKIDLWKDALLRYLAAQRDHPGLYHPNPKPQDFKLDDWTAEKIREQVEADFRRKV